MAAGAIAEVRTGDGKCYDSYSIEIPAGVRNFKESSRFSKVTVKVGKIEVKSDMMAVVSFDRIGNVRACAVVSLGATSVALGNEECVITFGTDYVLTISKAGAVY